MSTPTPPADHMALLAILAATLNALREAGYSATFFDHYGSANGWKHVPFITNMGRTPSPEVEWKRGRGKEPGQWIVTTNRYPKGEK